MLIEDCKIDYNLYVLPKIGSFGLLKEIAKKAKPYLYFSVSIFAIRNAYFMLKYVNKTIAVCLCQHLALQINPDKYYSKLKLFIPR